jgi:signal transduction histidine kinase/PAS domain-containing protein
MFLEGEFNWVLVLGVAAAVTTVLMLVFAFLAVRVRVSHATATDELDLVQKVAAAADKRLYETLNAIPVALVETDRGGKFVFANRAAHQLLGRRDAELIGLRFHSATWGITYPDGRPVPPDLLPSARALRGQTVKGFQHLLANPATRRKMLVSVTAMPIEDEQGAVIGSTAAIVETEGLTSSETAYPAEPEISAVAAPASDLTRRVFEAASSALVVVGVDGQVREANRTALLVIGRSDGVVGGDFSDLFLGEDERVEGRQALRAAVSAPAGEAEPILARRSGEAGVQWRILPLAGDDGAVDALLLAGERAPPEGEDAVEIEAPVEGATEEAAEAAASAAVAREAELAAERDQALSRAAAALAAAEAARQEAETARAQAAEAEARARTELEGGRRMESVGRLTGGVAHDFNALLGVMTSALDMMLRQADDPARVRRLGEAALAAGQRGEALTRRLTAFSQGDDAPVLQVMDAGMLLRGLEGRLRTLVGPGVDLMIEAPPEPALARLDPVAFDGAVKALVLNAAEAVAGQGSVAVRLESLMEGGLRLSVRDSGPGMDRDLATRAVEPFFTTKPGAAGLGLSQAYAFARQSSGRLSIDSAPGEGAEVAITLPAAETDPSTADGA